ncbi:phosphatidate cytidylyltransferase [Bauldia sp.]|uniref:phosphatidate cytidylyltransferase n=1 Tax=Bauldia sp. TaxID=2575872 RepID=UPI003BABB715
MATRELATRVASAIVLIAIAAFGAWWGGLASGLVVAALVAIVYLEWSQIIAAESASSWIVAGGLAVGMALAGMGFLLLAFLFCAGLALAGGLAPPRPWRLIGIVYAAAFGLSLLVLRAPTGGLQAIAFLLPVVWATDIGAFFAGRAIGGAKLWPAVSPNKTWAGAIGGLASAIVVGVAVAAALAIPLTIMLVAVIVALSVASQCGDLFESHLKRRFGAKDSSKLIPGHGGLMDRVDGLVFAAVVAVVIGLLHGGPNDVARGLVAW